MAKENNMPDYGEAIINWKIPEYTKYDRDKKWYYVALSLGFIFVVYAIMSGNFLFALIVVISGVIIALHDKREPSLVDITVTNEGIVIGKKFYDYDDFRDFSIVYKPNVGVENLYFRFNNSIKQRLSLPLNDTNPLPIRENLLQYLPEDLERVDETPSEGLAKLFKL